ncbi:Protein translocase subunit SecD [Candidatus Erwinia haradaeae]|uniref:Protein translocase subunit SecD n=1 Tax=Candidatus Erwinia haradaeae TaxID=1922217 RepID=A0A451DK28_9GAMM|nr:protein translocase subunit SecD [Candidatus Erwinia haradaeae]VFP87070.1 Protein translocase subunit SecD [Candidatus Erwinia haradaeae]
MLNRYPLWKYLMLILTLLIGLLYALPNLYGEDPAIQITSARKKIMNKNILTKIQNALKQKNIESKSVILGSDDILIRFISTDLQLKGHEVITRLLGKDYIVALNLAPAIPKWLSMLSANPMKLGLDLRGGVHFLVDVDMDTIMSKLQDNILDKLRQTLTMQGMPYINLLKGNQYEVLLRFRDTVSCDNFIKYLVSCHSDMVIQKHVGHLLTVRASDQRIQTAREYALQQNIHILRNRVTQLGLADILVQRQGEHRIIVELPGIQDTARAKEILGATAMLEFRLVNTMSDANGVIPDDSELKETRDGQAVVVYKKAILTGDHIIDSTYSTNEYNEPQVNILLDNSGGNIMSSFTRKHIGKAIATIFTEYRERSKRDINSHSALERHDEIINLARIQSSFGSSFCISGISYPQEARQLTLLLRAGALSAPIQIIEERIIGPSLALQNIKQGVTACVCGVVASIVFMIMRYKIFGLAATCALLANLILMVAIISVLPGATLTMPGIAGIVLTLVVAVDANVLINERIREELRNQRSIQKAIDVGYQAAFSSILDANITMLIKVIILYAVGSGSIKGFAITTGIGIATSMFTSLVGTRAIINLIYGGKRIHKLSI